MSFDPADQNWLQRLFATTLGRTDLMPKRGDDGCHDPVPDPVDDEPLRSWGGPDPHELTAAEQAWADRMARRAAPADPAGTSPKTGRELLKELGVPEVMADEVGDASLDPGHPDHPWNAARAATSRRLAAETGTMDADLAAEADAAAARAARDGQARAAAREETRARLNGERQAALDSATGVTRRAAYEETRQRLAGRSALSGQAALEIVARTEFRPEFY